MVIKVLNTLSDRLRNGQGGFSMVGLLVAVAIVGIVSWYFLSGGSGGGYNPPSKTKVEKDLQKARQGASVQEKATLKQALKQYRIDNGQYPETLEELAAEDYVPNSALTDANGNPYDYNPNTGRIE